jgi:hypothetical protein
MAEIEKKIRVNDIKNAVVLVPLDDTLTWIHVKRHAGDLPARLIDAGRLRRPGATCLADTSAELWIGEA